MSVISQFLKPEVFARLSEREISQLIAVVDGEIATSPVIKKILQGRIDELVPHLANVRAKRATAKK